MRPPLLNRLRRFPRAADGVVALEFAFLALPFLFIIFALLELAIVFLLSASLDTAMERAARRVRTGDLQTAPEFAALSGAALAAAQEQEFKDEVCRQMQWLAGGCPKSFFVDVQVFDEWAKTHQQSDPIVETKDADGTVTSRTFDENATVFESGGPRAIVLARGYYKWPMLTPFLSQAVINLDGNVALVTSAQAFRNEPYST